MSARESGLTSPHLPPLILCTPLPRVLTGRSVPRQARHVSPRVGAEAQRAARRRAGRRHPHGAADDSAGAGGPGDDGGRVRELRRDTTGLCVDCAGEGLGLRV